MSNKQFQQFIERTKNTKLSVQEKELIKNSVLNFVKNNPVRTSDRARLGFWSTLSVNKLSLNYSMTILLIITLIVGGGVAVGADQALPGDVLYPVKIGLNEEVKGWFHASEEAKADWEVRRVERRLQEAEALAVEGGLNTEAREKIEANFEVHAERVRERIKKFEDKENYKAAVDVSTKFETSLNAHQEILKKLRSEIREELRHEVRPIEIRIKSEADSTLETREKIQSRIRARTIEREEAERNEVDDKSNEETDNMEVEGENNTDVESSSVKTESRLRVQLDL